MIVVKPATEPWEFDQIFKLNYDTFVEEIPQHGANAERLLRDKFHAENHYIIAVAENEVLGMISVNDKRPFSLDSKLDNLDSYLPHFHKLCEVRLLSVKKHIRGSFTFHKLLMALLHYCSEKGYDMAVISGTVLQEKLYTKIGFAPFADKVGTTEALYQPMYITWDRLNSYLQSS